MKAIIGDIHGCAKTFEILMNKLVKKYNIDSLYFLGDLIDRGPLSKEVLNIAISLKNDYPCCYLLGNHEDLLIDYVYKQNRYDANLWLDNGGRETIMSFQKDVYCNQLPKEGEIMRYFSPYMEFINSLPEYLIIYNNRQKFLLSHGGVYNFDFPPERQYETLSDENRKIKYPFIWSRNTDFSDKKYYDYIIIHGHTPIHTLGLTENAKKPYINKKNGVIISINIDTGCVYGYALSAILIDEANNFYFETVAYGE